MMSFFKAIGKAILSPFTLISAFSTYKKIHDPYKWVELVKKFKMTPDDQRAICKKYNLTRPLIENSDTYEHDPLQGAVYIDCANQEVDYETDNERKRAIDKWERNLTTLWADSGAPDISFEYRSSNGETTIRTISPEEVLFNKDYEFYVRGNCHLRKSIRTLKISNATHLLESEGELFAFDEWCQKYIEIDIENFVPKEAQFTFLKVIWQGKCPLTTFSYRDWDSRKRMTVTPIRLLLTPDNRKNLEVIDEEGNIQTLFVQRIPTMLATEGHKKMKWDEWVEEVLLKKTTKSI